jgi:PAS domain S-box-containing protein
MVSIAGQDRRDSAGQLGQVRELLMRMPAAVAYLGGPDLIYEFANEEYRRVVGDRAPVGRSIGEVLPELSAEHVQAVRQVVMTGQEHRWREPESWIRRRGRESERAFVVFAYQPVRDAAGSVTGVLQYATDVTGHLQDRRRLEALAELSTAAEEQYLNLFETLPQGVVYYGADGSVLAANPAAREILGLEPGAITTWPLIRDKIAFHEDCSPYRRDEFPVMVALRTGQIVANQLVGLSREPAGEQQWLRVTAIPDSRDAQGRPQRAYAMFADVTEQRRVELALREGNRLLGGLRDANLLGVVVADEACVIEANDAYLDMIGYTRAEFDSNGIEWRAITPPDWADSDDDAIGQLRRTGVYQPYEKEYVHRDGHRVPVLLGGAVTDWRPLRWAAFAVDLTARQRAEDERATLLAREQAARMEADVAQERLAFLLRAGDLVAATRNRDDLLGQVTQLVVPTLADYCVAFAPVAGGKLCATKLTHRDPAKGEALKLLREHPIPALGPLIVQKAYATGSTQLAREFTAATPRWSDAEPGLMNLADKVNPTSALAVPLVVGEQPLGVLLLGRGDPRPRFAETDVAIVEELARRLAAGLANVETFAREHTVAETLQRALLPADLPRVEGLDLAVHYLPASDGVHVGGDWYDAFPLSRGRVGLVIGDVAGHSIESASIMGQIRSLLHGYAIDDAAPADVLRRTNAAVSQMLPDAVATACYAVLDTTTGDLDYASAGHPPVLVATGRGHAEYLDGPPGIMLGVSTNATFAAGHRRLPPGAELLFYTDGLVEHRHLDIADGLAALQAALEQSRAQTAEQLCEFVQATLIGSAPRADDVCILAARLPDLPPPAHSANLSGAMTPEIAGKSAGCTARTASRGSAVTLNQRRVSC